MNCESHQTANATSAMGRRILLIEDDLELAEEIISYLQGGGYDLRHAATGSQGAAKLRSEPFDLLIVDRMLPEIDGLSIIELMRKENRPMPVLIISALGDADERARGLAAGADDYLTKPFSFIEMNARLEALLRPSRARAAVLEAGAISLDLGERVARLDGEVIELSPREFQLLEYFISRPGQIVTRDMLLESVWKYRFSPQTNIVDIHVGKLSGKISGTRGAARIQNVRDYGFMFSVSA